MSRNIKEIGKELLGKSLNSYHRRTGLTQLEKNNNIQDGILGGILSQVDDAYIEKTEQSNVIHLEGSGDGVVVLDGIEGNTMVNLATMDNWREGKSSDTHRKVTITSPTSWKKVYKYFHLKPNTIYTIFIKITNNSDATTGKMYIRYVHNQNATTADGAIGNGQTGVFNKKITLDNTGLLCLTCESGVMTGDVIFEDLLLLEGDWTNKEMPTYFEGLQSSFEEKVNDEGKYEIEILSHNKNLFNINDYYTTSKSTYEIKDNEVTITTPANLGNPIYNQFRVPKHFTLKKDKVYTISGEVELVNANNNSCTFLVVSPNKATYTVQSTILKHGKINTTFRVKQDINQKEIIKNKWQYDLAYEFGATATDNSQPVKIKLKNILIEENEFVTDYTPHKQNKIKLLLNEPLRGIGNTKDRLCVKDNKLMVERNIYGFTHTPIKTTIENIDTQLINDGKYRCKPKNTWNTISGHLVCDKNSEIQEYNLCRNTPNTIYIEHKVANNPYLICINSSDLSDRKICYILENPYYEEVLNEYGEPIILEGYENGTIFIDSTIVPTTTLRYTPKMESMRTLKAVSHSNNMVSDDINTNIIDYMMNIDLMIMEKEMALSSRSRKKNIKKIGVKSMTNMQKRTKEMLERLFRGKTLTKEECQTRVTIYLNAGKITDEQAEELMLIIEEIYA